jgi:hypothetical protein
MLKGPLLRLELKPAHLHFSISLSEFLSSDPHFGVILDYHHLISAGGLAFSINLQNQGRFADLRFFFSGDM